MARFRYFTSYWSVEASAQMVFSQPLIPREAISQFYPAIIGIKNHARWCIKSFEGQLLLADITNHSARFLVLIHIFMCTILP